MLYNWLAALSLEYPFLDPVNHISFRSMAAIFTALGVSFLIGPLLIAWLRKRQGNGQPIRRIGPSGHGTKQGTPTMGGMLILLSLLISSLLWTDVGNPLVITILGVTTMFGLIGAWDDMTKLIGRDSGGLKASTRLIAESAIALAVAGWVFAQHDPATAGSVPLPILKDLLIPLGVGYILFAAFVIVGSANAVNLTDGLDGLAIVPAMMVMACYALICWLTGNAIFSDYLNIIHVPGAGELTIFCAAFIGAGLGFLWFNAPPAAVFMGDTGALSVGAAIGTIAVMARHELILVIIGGLFVFETISVIIQILSFRITGKRVFRMAPIHHHFEERGWPEATVVIRFWIISAVLSLGGLVVLRVP